MSTTDDTTIATPSRGHRLRRAATRTAVVLGFAVGGWLVATGSASADTAPPPPTSGTLLGGAGSLLGSVSTPLAPAATALTAPVAQATPVVAAVTAPVAPVVAAVVAPVAPVVAAVTAPVAPVVAAVVAPVAPVVAALAPVLAPVTVTLAPATTEGLFAVVADPAGAAADSAPTQPAASTGAVSGPVAAGPVSLPAGPVSLPAVPAAEPTTAGDPAANSTTPAAPAATTAPAAPTGAPTDGPVLPVSAPPAAPVGAPGAGSGNTSATGLGQVVAVVADPADLHLRTRSSRTSTSDEVSLPAFVADPGFSPD